ncbi:hypothetical protein Vafri_21436 [Volvox africanus]|nr:hypothetical protein Vafri_21436 [Volvox africanus]
MSAVELAAKELGQANVNASGTFSKLQQAAAQLDVIAGAGEAGGAAGANGTSKSGKGKGTQTSQEWGLQTLVKEHKQHAAETKVFKAVEQMLTDVRDELRRTASGVATVVTQLDAAIAQLSNSGGSGSAAADAAGTEAAAAVAAESSGTTTGANSKVHSGGDGSAGSSGSGSVGGSGSTSSMRNRANDLAQELGKALGAFRDVAGNATMAGKSLTQVRSTAVSTLMALNQTIAVLDHVTAAVDAAKKSNKHDDEIKKAAALAMRLALNATATSALAMQLTGEALQRSATEEASELLGMLVQVSHDLEKTSARAKVAKAKRAESSNTTTTAAAAAAAAAVAAATDTASALGAVSTGAAFTVEQQAAADAAGSTVSTAVGGNNTAAKAAGSLAANANAAGKGASSAASTSDQGKNTGTKISSGAGAAGEGALVDLGGSQTATGGAGNTGGTDGSVESPAGTQTDPAAEAAGQLEQVIKDLNSKIAAASTATGSTTDAARAQAAAAAAAAAATAAAASAVAATGAGGEKTAVDALHADGGKAADEGALVDLSGANGSTAKPTDTADSVAAGDSARLGSGNLNVSGIAAVLRDAVAVTKVNQEEALQEIKQSLTSTDAAVAERVVDILKDLSENGDSLGKGLKATTAGSGSEVEAVLTGGGGESAAAAAVAAVADGSNGGGVEGALLGLVHKITDSVSARTDDSENVEGPVVKVDTAGNLIQEDGDGDDVVGPIVKDADAQLSSSASSSASRDLKKADAALPSGSGAAKGNGNEGAAGGTSDSGGVKLRKLGLGLGLTAGRAK